MIIDGLTARFEYASNVLFGDGEDQDEREERVKPMSEYWEGLKKGKTGIEKRKLYIVWTGKVWMCNNPFSAWRRTRCEGWKGLWVQRIMRQIKQGEASLEIMKQLDYT